MMRCTSANATAEIKFALQKCTPATLLLKPKAAVGAEAPTALRAATTPAAADKKRARLEVLREPTILQNRSLDAREFQNEFPTLN